MGVRLSDEIAPDMYNYGHFQVLFDDGSLGWYEAGWGPMMSDTAFFVKDVISPNGAVSIRMPETPAPTTWTPTPGPRPSACAAIGAARRGSSMAGEPGHQALCDREQAFVARAIAEDLDLTRHMDDAVARSRVCLAADESVRPAGRSGSEGDPPVGSLTLHSVRKSFGKVDVHEGHRPRRRRRRVLVFVGPSGCGKSTLLRIIAGLEDATAGDVLIDGERVDAVPPAERGIAMVFQTYALYPHLTVRDNMALGLKQAGAAGAEIDARVAEAAGMLSLEPLLERRPAELSGGQRQRVAIGRAIVREPKLFLFDEPLSNLDAALRVNTRLEIARLHRELKATMIYVTHDQVEAMTLADKIVVLNAGRDRADRHPDGALQRPGEHLRRRLHRLAADELPRRRRARRNRQDHRHPARAPDASTRERGHHERHHHPRRAPRRRHQPLLYTEAPAS